MYDRGNLSNYNQDLKKIWPYGDNKLTLLDHWERRIFKRGEGVFGRYKYPKGERGGGGRDFT